MLAGEKEIEREMYTEKEKLRYSALFNAVRYFHNMDQTNFAGELGVTQGTISKVSSNKDNFMTPSVRLLFSLCNAFDLDIREVKEFIEAKTDTFPIKGYYQFLIWEDSDRVKKPEDFLSSGKGKRKKFDEADFENNRRVRINGKPIRKKFNRKKDLTPLRTTLLRASA